VTLCACTFLRNARGCTIKALSVSEKKRPCAAWPHRGAEMSETRPVIMPSPL
jgi:hypothetical protein